VRRRLVAAAVAGLLASACTAGAGSREEEPVALTTLPPLTTTTSTTTTTTTTMPPRFTLEGIVVAPDGTPLDHAVVTATGATAGADLATVTGSDGAFFLEHVPASTVVVTRPGWEPAEVAFDGSAGSVQVTLQPRRVRALRVIAAAAADPATFASLLEMADDSDVNALVFDAKDEAGAVYYATEVQEAADIGAVEPLYDPAELVADAHRHDLYTIARIAVFEDPVRARQRSEHKLAGSWMDPTDESNWEYPLQLAVEACTLGFDEIQFDYVRFPAGVTGQAARSSHPTTQAERIAAVVGFLDEARARLHPVGCAVAADIFAIVLSSPDDQGIGQRPEELSEAVDVISPMVYPNHYDDGWLGFADPADHPAAVVADALDDGMVRLVGTAVLRPWLQAFSYSSGSILAEIGESEQRELGWMLWNPGSRYDTESLPVAGERDAATP